MRYIYFRNDKNKGVACVGYSVDNKDITMGFAFCSPNDNFAKKKARTIINGRIAKGKKIIFDSDEEDPRYEVIAKYAKDCLNEASKLKGENVKVGDVNVPSWLIKI